MPPLDSSSFKNGQLRNIKPYSDKYQARNHTKEFALYWSIYLAD